ncbi:PhoX family phosphatase [Variovorax sp. OV329]|uniref:PhoX family protein n=1 Tax=Variovorax sp. OV329 TaxID=1882825 RepID=UPI000B82DF8A|nr:alkaline phosphatase PhoX [Variovorax sp. OV329]
MGRGIGFKSVPMQAVDSVVVPEGYTASVLYRWGDPVGIAGRLPAFAPDASNSADDQAAQAGMHHDGMAFFPAEGSSTRGLLVMNHEYVDDGLLHPDGMKTWTAEKVRKSMNAHGVSVIEIERGSGTWKQVAPSRADSRASPSRMRPPRAATTPWARSSAGRKTATWTARSSPATRPRATSAASWSAPPVAR